MSISRVGPQGQFALTSLAPGTYAVRGHAPWGSAYVDGLPRQVTVPDSGRVDGVDLLLRRGGAVTGRVTDSAGQPLAGIKVGTGYWHGGYGGFTGDMEVVPTETDAEGRYRLQGMPAGTYTLQFVDEDGKHAWTFWKKASDRDSATRLTVSLGQTLTGVSPTLRAAARISGRVVSAETGQPLDMVCFQPVDASAGHLVGRGGCSDADGRYTVSGLPADAYKLQLWDATDRFVGAGTAGTESAAEVFRTRTGKTTSAGEITYVAPPPYEEPPFEEPIEEPPLEPVG